MAVNMAGRRCQGIDPKQVGTANNKPLFIKLFARIWPYSRPWATVCCVVTGLLGAEPARADSTLNVVLESEITTLDPMRNTAYINRTLGFLVYDTLFGMDSAMHPRPQMVDRWLES